MPASPADLPPNKAILLRNCTCPYCGTTLDGQNRTKEHVIGRRFVPKGKLENQWNLILGACRSCNNRKSELEDDLSAITLQPDAAGAYSEEALEVRSEAERKGRNSFSRKTGQPISNCRERLTVNLPICSLVNSTVSLVAPPQPEPDRLFELARFHLTAFFYWLTFNHGTNRGFWWPGDYLPVMQSHRGDWGNVTQRAFQHAVSTWEPRVQGVSAFGYFKIVVRRHPQAELWAWALEWNKQYRLIGFIGNRAASDTLRVTFPIPQMTTVQESPNEYFRFREEHILPAADDKLFDFDSPQPELTA